MAVVRRTSMPLAEASSGLAAVARMARPMEVRPSTRKTATSTTAAMMVILIWEFVMTASPMRWPGASFIGSRSGRGPKMVWIPAVMTMESAREPMSGVKLPNFASRRKK